MIKIFEHRGMHVFLDSSSYDEIRVVAKYRKRESVGLIDINQGEFSGLHLQFNLEGKDPLPAKQLLEFEDMLSIYSEDIVALWNRLIQQSAQINRAS
ncbi:MAG: hypothetical protein VX642_03220 [Bdellovibrionota bacterium]|nr:hypothetical protein [Bdellovibrionota bacterium]